MTGVTRRDKVTTLRLAADCAAELELIARVEAMPVSELLRAAIAAEIARRRADPEFAARLRARIEADGEILRRLADGGVPS